MQKIQSGVLFLVVAFAAIFPLLEKEEKKKISKQQPIEKEVAPPLHIPAVELPDFAAIRDVKTKKKAFFDYIVPIIELVNREVQVERKFIEKLHNRPQSGHNADKLAQLAKKYDVLLDEPFEQIKIQLMLKIDTLPTALVAMQAANESAWGTSRFALDANNLFGQWCFTKGCGLVPSGRPEGKTYEVRKFKHPLDSVRSYFHNINSGWAYEDLRQMRAQLRQTNEELDPHQLAEGLIAYSTRREHYVAEIQQMIRVNKKYIENEES